jgi:hypothetical protein
MVNYSFGAPTRFYPRGPGDARSAFSLRKPFGFSRGVSGSNFYRWLLSSNVTFPLRSPIPAPVTAPLRTATGAGLYARVPMLSRLILEKIFTLISPDFRAFRDIQKVHQQLISTGGNLITVLWKTPLL